MALTTPEVLALSLIKSASGTLDGGSDIINMLDDPKILISATNFIIPVAWWFSFPDSDAVVDPNFYLISYPAFSLQASQYQNAIACFSTQGAPCVVGGSVFTGHNSAQTITNAPTYANLFPTIALQQATNAHSTWVGPPIKWQIYYIEFQP